VRRIAPELRRIAPELLQNCAAHHSSSAENFAATTVPTVGLNAAAIIAPPDAAPHAVASWRCSWSTAASPATCAKKWAPGAGE